MLSSMKSPLLIFPLILILLNDPVSSEHVCILRDAPDLPPTPLPRHRINDDYCDCIDATDENRTSACSNGHFSCRNRLYRQSTIHSSWVHDGSCDCCDGSDEPPGKCPDTCKALQQNALKEAKRSSNIVKNGMFVRKRYIQDARNAINQDLTDIRRLEKKLAKLQLQLIDSKKRSDALTKRRDWENKIKKAADPSSETDNDDQNEHEQVKELQDEYHSDEYHSDEDHDEIKADKEDPDFDLDEGDLLDDNDKIRKEEEEEEEEEEEKEQSVRNVQREVVPQAEQIGSASVNDEIPESSHEVLTYAPESDTATKLLSMDDQEQLSSPAEGSPTSDSMVESQEPGPAPDVDMDSLCAQLESSSPNAFVRRLVYFRVMALKKLGRFLPERISAKFGSALDDVNICANRAESAMLELQSKEREIKNKIEELKRRSSADYGNDKVLRKLLGACTKNKITQYEFEICMFGEVRQYEQGSIIAKLGVFEGWEGEGKNRVMKYTNGDFCWNGPQRSIKVQLLCGEIEEVVSVNEPNRCTYIMVFKTPAVCEQSMIYEIMAEVRGEPVNAKEEL